MTALGSTAAAWSATAGVISVDRFPENRPRFFVYLSMALELGTPAWRARCGIFDGIGVRPPGIMALAGSYVGRQLGLPTRILAYRVVSHPVLRHDCVVKFCKWNDSVNELWLGDLTSVSRVMLGCRAQIPSKGKQKIGAYSLENGLSK